MIFCLGYGLMFATIYGSSYKEGNWDYRGQIVVSRYDSWRKADDFILYEIVGGEYR